MTQQTLEISELDFFKLKTALKEYFKSLDTFTDYDFEGTALNTLIEALAYEAHYVGAYTNMAFSETFLDTAVQRASIVSRANELGYVPRSISASRATIRFSFKVNGNPLQYVLPRGTKFSGISNEVTYNFITKEDILFNNDGTDVFSKDISIHQGILTDISYTVDVSNPIQSFELGTTKADTSFITVTVKDNASAILTTKFNYNKDVSIGSLAPDAEVYFLKENYRGLYEVYFGDGVVAKALENGNIVNINYLVTEGKEANGISTFVFASSLSELTDISITTIDPSTLGSNQESKESIAFTAPLHYQSQGRAVTENDYAAIIRSNYPGIDDVQVWGGEKNDPPFYGKVFIAVKTSDGRILSNTIKQSIQNDIISQYNIVSVRPELVNPDFIDIAVDTVVTYDSSLYSTVSTTSLETTVTEGIETFFENESNRFGQPLYYSKLVAAVDDSSPVILNSITNITLSKSLEAFIGIDGTYDFSFNNSIFPGAALSNEFTQDGIAWRIKDVPIDGTTEGKLVVFRKVGATETFLSEDIGTVDYNSGKIVINDIRIDSIVDDAVFNSFTISVSPGPFTDLANPQTVYSDYNVYTNGRDEIIRLKDNGVSVTVLPSTAAST